MTTALTVSPSPALLPARLFAPTPKAARRVLEFFTAQINNDHTRKSYLNATRRFAALGVGAKSGAGVSDRAGERVTTSVTPQPSSYAHPTCL